MQKLAALMLLAGCASASISPDNPPAALDPVPAGQPTGAATVAEVLDSAPPLNAEPGDSAGPEDADAAQPDPPPPPPPPPADAAGPCVDYVTVPESSTWVARAHYTPSAGTTQTVPYYCPTATDGNSCRAVMVTRGAVLVSGGYRLYPVPGACRIDVPAKCLPCTGVVTQW
jgi:hypothetical protein